MFYPMNLNPLSAANDENASAAKGSVAKIVAILLLVASILVINALVVG
jgi:hypothetical protein